MRKHRKRLQTASWHPRWGTCSLDAQGPRQTLPTSPGSSGERTKWNRTRLKRQMSQMSQICRQRSLFFTIFYHSPIFTWRLPANTDSNVERLGMIQIFNGLQVWLCLCCFDLCLYMFVLRNPGRDGIHRKEREAQ